MHCFANENQTYTGTWPFGVESWKSLKGQENLLLKNLQVKTCVENVRFLSWRIFFVGKYGIQSTNEMAFKRTVSLHESFWFPTIRCAHVIVVQRMHACACKMPSCSIFHEYGALSYARFAFGSPAKRRHDFSLLSVFSICCAVAIFLPLWDTKQEKFKSNDHLLTASISYQHHVKT